MENEQTALWSAGSVAAGAFLAGVLPSSWPWTYQLPVVLAGCGTVYLAAKLFGPRKR